MNARRNEAIRRQPRALDLVDLHPPADDLLADVVAGLSRPDKRLPCKYFYDHAGSQLFDRICELPEYYPTRTEIAIMKQYGREIAQRVGQRCVLIEYGSGSSIKTEILLRYVQPAAYVPVDISRQHLLESAQRIADDHPSLDVVPVCADFTSPFDIPVTPEVGRRVVYFPGSTLGNLTRPEALTLLQGVGALCRRGGGLLIGLDLDKDPEILLRAYDDNAGVTAAFNRNLLTRINRELGADFRPGAFRHRAVYDPTARRIEMHLVSQEPQRVRVGEHEFAFGKGEIVLTEYSHKYTLDGFSALAGEAGLSVEAVWQDSKRYFAVQYLSVL